MGSTDPIVFISRNRIRHGQLDGLRAFLGMGVPMLELGKPRTAGFLAYIDEPSMTLTIVHVFADAAAFAAHVEGADDRSTAAERYIQAAAIEIHGTPDPATLDAIRAGLPSDIPVTVQGEFAAGFLRPG
jgi:hypothetical protein